MTLGTTRWVLLDTSHSSLQFHGTWNNTAAPTEAGGSNTSAGTHYRTNGTSSLSFTYAGSGVRVLGPRSTDTTQPTWDCFVDGEKLPSNPHSYTQDLSTLCLASSLPSDGDHVFSLNVTSEGVPFRISEILVHPPPDLPLDNPTVVIDDHDPDVEYLHGNWQREGHAGRMTFQQGTIVRVGFFGTRASWIGLCPQDLLANPSRGSYTIDEQEKATFEIPAVQPEGMLGSCPLFTTDKLDDQYHTLCVEYKGGGAPLSFHHLLVENGSFSLPKASPDCSIL
ncbi:hypothetical protein BKA70DRAFT_790401 [Coprinopsis sp. MPI-PUGE-AT-0042]|nr:hypothetical protein BKA70DRAFT_790401 [Coprinopsis sp. MPI-PUGE-AT-0042]